MEDCRAAFATQDRASIGPASENAGYGPDLGRLQRAILGFNWSSVRDRRLCPLKARRQRQRCRFNWSSVRERRLCVLRGRGAILGFGFNGSSVRERRLCPVSRHCGTASMGPALQLGPASENAGYVPPLAGGIQLVQRPRTPVMVEMGFNGSSVRERRLCGRCGHGFNGSSVRERRLWEAGTVAPECGLGGFNWSSVRERRLCRRASHDDVTELVLLQLVQRPRTPVMKFIGYHLPLPGKGFNWSSVRERRLCQR